MIILGIDPGIATTGWGVIRIDRQKPVFLGVGVITTPPHTPLAERLETLHKDLKELFQKFKPNSVVLEDLFFNANAKTALIVGQARGVVLLTAQLYKADIFAYTPQQVKMGVTGYGRADKKQVQEMVKNILNLDGIPKPDDAADALAIALTHVSRGAI